MDHSNDLQVLIEQYLERAQSFQEEADRLHKKYIRYSIVRLVAFFGGIAILVLLWQTNWWIGTLGTIGFLLAFYRFMTWHLGIKNAEEHQNALALINRQEAQVMDHDFSFFKDGSSFADPLHPYAIDLDIFGPFSFFQYTNRSTTVIGSQRLADVLNEPIPLAEIPERQIAIKELSDNLDWRQHFQAHGLRTSDSEQAIDLLHRWINQVPFILSKKWLLVVLYILPVLNIGLVSWFIYQANYWAALFTLLPAGLLLRQYVMRVNIVHQQTTHAEKALSAYAQLIRHIENQVFRSQYLLTQQTSFKAGASDAIDHLSYIISQLNTRYNAFSIIFNLFGLWDLQWVYRLEKWKKKHQLELADWFQGLANFEMVSSLATTSFNNPDWTFPEISKDPDLSATQLGHPLIKESTRICNDVILPTQSHIKLLTGSNMAGKSTFLRTVGLNIVLAMAGAPVCAEKMKLPFLKVFTSMRTQDALHESTSSFYAELKRLKLIIEAVEQGDQLFFLLDEILKGTNSKDRHTGSKALIKQLIKEGGGGIIATHDLELGSLEAQYDGQIENWCMEVRIQNGKLDFDYKIEKGVSQSFNATLLMQEMGIRIDSDL